MAKVFLHYSYVCTNGPISFCIPKGILTKIFSRQLTAVHDWPEDIVQQWLQFEREEGDLKTMEEAILR